MQALKPVVISQTPKMRNLLADANAIVNAAASEGADVEVARRQLDTISRWIDQLNRHGWTMSEVLTVSIFCTGEIGPLFKELQRLAGRVKHAIRVDREIARQAYSAKPSTMFKLDQRATLREVA